MIAHVLVGELRIMCNRCYRELMPFLHRSDTVLFVHVKETLNPPRWHQIMNISHYNCSEEETREVKSFLRRSEILGDRNKVSVLPVVPHVLERDLLIPVHLLHNMRYMHTICQRIVDYEARERLTFSQIVLTRPDVFVMGVPPAREGVLFHQLDFV